MILLWWQQLVLVMLGGALGAGMRFWIGGLLMRQLGSGFPWGTFAVNLLGAFVGGFLAVWLEGRGSIALYWRAFLIVGLLGGLTTYSAMMIEWLLYTRSARTGLAFVYLLLTLLLGMGLVWAGCQAGAGVARLIASLRGLPGSVWLLGAISLLNDAASEMVYPLLPLFLASTLAAGPRVLGLIEGLAEAISCALKLLSGVWSDRTRRAKPFVVWGYGVAGLARTLIAAASGWWFVLACRLADRIGKGLRSSPRDALLGRAVRAHDRGLAFGVHRALDNAGAVVGPLVASALLATGMELRNVFWWAGVPAVLVMLLTLRLRETPRQETTAPSTRFNWHLREFPPRFRRYLLILGLFMLGNSSNLFLILRAREFGVPQAQVPLLWALTAFVAAVLLPPLSALSDRVGRRRLILAGWALYATLYGVLAIGGLPAWAVWLVFASYGVFVAATEGAEKAMVADFVPREQLGTAFGWYHLTLGVTLLPASLVFGVFWESVSPALAFGFGAACALAASLLLVFWLRPED